MNVESIRTVVLFGFYAAKVIDDFGVPRPPATWRTNKPLGARVSRGVDLGIYTKSAPTSVDSVSNTIRANRAVRYEKPFLILLNLLNLLSPL